MSKFVKEAMLLAAECRRAIEMQEEHDADEALRAHLEAREALVKQMANALHEAEAGLADIVDADREPGDDWACEQRAAQALPVARAALAAYRKESQ